MLIQTHHEDQNVNISTDGSGLEGLFCKKTKLGLVTKFRLNAGEVSC